MIIGIDNGTMSGGIVIMSDTGSIIAKRTLPYTRPRTRPEINIPEIIAWLKLETGDNTHRCSFIIEEPNNSKTASTAYAVASCFHSFRGLLEAKGWEWRRATPQAWQKSVLGKCRIGETKIKALIKAKELWPDENWRASSRCKIPHPGLVDAALIAHYGRTSLFTPKTS